jgi:hypothetical protein
MDYKSLTPKIKFGTFKIEDKEAFAYQIEVEERNLKTSIAVGLYEKIDELILENMPDDKLIKLYARIAKEMNRRGFSV